MILNISIKRFITTLSVVIGIIFLLSMISDIVEFITGSRFIFLNMFSISTKLNVSTLFDLVNILFISLILLCIGIVHLQNKDRFVINWFFLSLFFLFIALEKILSHHEKIGWMMHNIPFLDSLGHLARLIPLVILALLALILNVKFLANLPKRSMMLFLIAGIIYAGSSMIFEVIAGPFKLQKGLTYIIYILCYNMEEMLEKVGMLLFLFALFDYILHIFDSIKIEFFKSTKE